MNLVVKGLAFSFTLTISAFAMDFSTESLIFNPTKITMYNGPRKLDTE